MSFDEDYAYVRKLVIKGKVRLADAKLWLIENGAKAEVTILKEKEMNMMHWGSGADREEIHINKVLRIKSTEKADEE